MKKNLIQAINSRYGSQNVTTESANKKKIVMNQAKNSVQFSLNGSSSSTNQNSTSASLQKSGSKGIKYLIKLCQQKRRKMVSVDLIKQYCCNKKLHLQFISRYSPQKTWNKWSSMWFNFFFQSVSHVSRDTWKGSKNNDIKCINLTQIEKPLQIIYLRDSK